MAASSKQALLGAGYFDAASAPPLEAAAGAGLTRATTGAPGFQGGLVELGVPTKLAEVLAEDDQRIGLRIYLLDNSGSMNACDGNVLRDHGAGRCAMQRGVSRWDEIAAMALDHARWNLTIGVCCEFVLLNSYARDQRVPPQAGRDFVRVDRQLGDHAGQVQALEAMLRNNSPRGTTPISARLEEIRCRIQSEYHELARQGQMVFLCLATDGLPTAELSGQSEPRDQQELVQKLRQICAQLPVQLVVRLCTDDPETIRFYNRIDEELELPLDILDDFESEALEVKRAGNGWFTYTPLLHRIREAGTLCKLFDAMDETRFAPSEARRFANLLCNSRAPLEQCSDREFIREVERVVAASRPAFDPLSGRPKAILSVQGLRRAMRVGCRGRILPLLLPCCD